MKKKTKERRTKRTSLRKKMIFYFLLIAIANIFVAGEIIFEIKSDSYRTKIYKETTLIKDGKKPVEHINTIMDKLAQKFVVMVLILTIVSAVVLFLFVIQIASPIQYMIDKAEKMTDGDLSIRIDIKTGDEIAVLGRLINDLSINMQEVVAQLERMVDNLDGIVNLHNENVKKFPNIESYFHEETEKLESILKEFKLLNKYYVLFTINAIMKNAEEDLEDSSI